VLVGQVAQKILEVDVVAALLDFAATWRLVIVKLSYADPANGVAQDQTFQIMAANQGASFSWRVPVKDQTKKTYTYTIEAYGQAGQRKTVGPSPSDDSALVLQL
jgi:hypothetical protein